MTGGQVRNLPWLLSFGDFIVIICWFFTYTAVCLACVAYFQLFPDCGSGSWGVARLPTPSYLRGLVKAVLLNWVYWLIGFIAPVVLRYLLNGALVITVMSMLLLLMEILAVVLFFCNCILIVSYISVCLCVYICMPVLHQHSSWQSSPTGADRAGLGCPNVWWKILCVRATEFLPCTHMVGTRGQEHLLNCIPQGGYLNFGTCVM